MGSLVNFYANCKSSPNNGLFSGAQIRSFPQLVRSGGCRYNSVFNMSFGKRSSPLFPQRISAERLRGPRKMSPSWPAVPPTLILLKGLQAAQRARDLMTNIPQRRMIQTRSLKRPDAVRRRAQIPWPNNRKYSKRPE